MKKKHLSQRIMAALAFNCRLSLKHAHSYELSSCFIARNFNGASYHCQRISSFGHSSTTTHLAMSTAAQLTSQDNDENQKRYRIGIIGGGASGMFAATAAADAAQRYASQQHQSPDEDEKTLSCDVIVFEGTSKTMSKVRISGGGRCNVMHDKTKPLPQILSSYPRGNKELRGMYTKRFTPDDAFNWFSSRGVELKTESDGRMFPTSDDSQTIIDAITSAATKAGVHVRKKEKVDSVEWIASSDTDDGGKFVLNVSSKSKDSSSRVKSEEQFDAIILATGSFPIGHEIARALGHTIVQPVPSLFTLDAKELVSEGGIFHDLAGLSVPWARLTLVVDEEMATPEEQLASEGTLADTKNKKKRRRKKPTTISQEGPLLITHQGVSGPAALRLSAFAAREFHRHSYQCEVKISFCSKWEEEQKEMKDGSTDGVVMDALWKMTRMIPKRRVSTSCPLFIKGLESGNKSSEGGDDASIPVIPKRLWSALVQYSDIPPTLTWGDASKSMIRSLANNVSSFQLRVTSKGTFKEEFVTAGGVHLKEVNMSDMQSKVKPGLLMCGEILDVDGVTGGFNFMGCWSTGFVAGESAAKFCCE